MQCLPGIVGCRLPSERRCWDCKGEMERERGLGCALEGAISHMSSGKSRWAGAAKQALP